MTFARILAALALLAVPPWAGAARAAGPVETSVFAVTGVDVDVTASDASAAKTQAIIEAQVKGFKLLAERLGGPGASRKFDGLDSKDIGRMLRSLSIEEEHTGPGRYIGKLTVRFLPAKIRGLFEKYGIDVVEDQSPAMIVLPVWKGPRGPVLWEDNPWRDAWENLRAEQAIVPIILPLGDLQDTGLLTAEQAMTKEPGKLESLLIRYDAKAVLVAVAEPVEGGVHATLNDDSPLGKITFDKIYKAESGSADDAAAAAAQRFHAVMIEKWRSVKGKMAAEAREREEARRMAEAEAAARSIPVAVPFSGAGEWNSIRSRIIRTPGVVGVDVSTIGGNGAMIRLGYATSFQNLQTALLGSGLRLREVGGIWVLQPL